MRLPQHSSKSVEWFTPAKYTDFVRAFLGGIELDPASCAAANKTVRAKRYFSDRGLEREYRAKTVFLNPPYGRSPGAGAWAAKLIREYEAGRAKECVLLVLAQTAQRWFQPLYEFPICFVSPRISYEPGGGQRKIQPATGSVFVYMGPRRADFVRRFSKIGTVMVRAKY